MNYSKFKSLIKGKEKAHVDFKTKCDAFLSRTLAPKAELAKDICAMANNGNVASYIIIGVSDDAKTFESVSNDKLTDDNLQSFCKSSIFPPPKVKLYRENWRDAAPKHKGKTFVIIQVGPQARRAFRLARDFINYREGLCYRNNEVWIRRGATTDLATPEEIARLVEGKAPTSRKVREDNVEYEKIPSSDKFEAVSGDLKKILEEIGGGIYGERVVIPIRRVRFVWRYILLQKYILDTVRFQGDFFYGWNHEHGTLIIVMENVSKRVFERYSVHLSFKERWGYFTQYDTQKSLGFPSLPVNTRPFSFVTLTLPKIVDTDSLRGRLIGMLQFLEKHEESYNRVRKAREGINSNLRRWLRQGLLHRTHRFYGTGLRPRKGELAENEIFNRRYANCILKRNSDPSLLGDVRTILDLSAGRLI
jgi:hypothetical protein